MGSSSTQRLKIPSLFISSDCPCLYDTVQYWNWWPYHRICTAHTATYRNVKSLWSASERNGDGNGAAFHFAMTRCLSSRGVRDRSSNVIWCSHVPEFGRAMKARLFRWILRVGRRERTKTFLVSRWLRNDLAPEEYGGCLDIWLLALI